MKYIIPSLVCISLLFMHSCKKDDAETQNECVTKNYGVLKVTYGSSTTKHSIVATLNANSFQEKISAIGVASDTIHLSSGTYNITVSSLNNANQSLNQMDFPGKIITQCNETNLTVPF